MRTAFVILVVLVAVACTLSGCAAHPYYLSCKGKGRVESAVNVLVYSGNVKSEVDCGDGLEIEQRKYAPKAPAATSTQPVPVTGATK